MTVKKKANGDFDIVKQGLGTNGFRFALLVLVVSMHPLGRQLLGTFGFEFPDQRKLTEATTEAQNVRRDIENLKENVKEIKDSSEINRANNAIVNTKLDRLDQTFTGFQVDFNKLRSETTTTAKKP